MTNISYEEKDNWKKKQLQKLSNQQLLQLKSDLLMGGYPQLGFHHGDIRLIEGVMRERKYYD